MIGDPLGLALQELRSGRLTIVVDDETRENEADLVGAAQHVTAEQMAFIVRHSTGIVCAPMTADRCDALDLAPMVATNTDPHGTAFTVSVDHVATGTGVSAEDRALTFRALADPATASRELRRPGHVFPLRSRTGGTLSRRGHTEAAIDLLQSAHMTPVGVISELVADDGSMLTGANVQEFAHRHGLRVVTVADIGAHRRSAEPTAGRSVSARLPTSLGAFRAHAFRYGWTDTENLALVLGNPAAHRDDANGVLVHAHQECLSGDVFGSLGCDCASHLEAAAKKIVKAGCGVIVYLRPHHGAAVDLVHPPRIDGLREPALTRLDYDVVADILADLGVATVSLLGNDNAQPRELASRGVDCRHRIPLLSNPLHPSVSSTAMARQTVDGTDRKDDEHDRYESVGG